MIAAQDWTNIQPVEIAPGFRARFIHSANMTFALWDVDDGALLPEHSHPHEQITQITQGQFEITVNGKTQVMGVGSLIVIPSHAIHSGKALTACKILDVFYPVREDYLNT